MTLRNLWIAMGIGAALTGSIWLVNHSGIGDPLRAPEELSLLHRSAGPNSNPIRSHKGNPRPAPVTAYAIVAPEPAEEGVTPAPVTAYAMVAPEPAEEGVTPAPPAAATAEEPQEAAEPLDARDQPAETGDWPELAAAWEKVLAEDLAGM